MWRFMSYGLHASLQTTTCEDLPDVAYGSRASWMSTDRSDCKAAMWMQAAEPSWGSTVLVDGTPASSVSGTVVVGQSLRPGDSIMRRGSEGLPGGFAGGTMVEQRGSTDGADYLAALGAAASHDRG